MVDQERADTFKGQGNAVKLDQDEARRRFITGAGIPGPYPPPSPPEKKNT